MSELVNQNEVHYGTLEGSAIVTMLKEHLMESFSQMYDHMVDYNTLMPNSSAAIERVRRSYGHKG